MGTRKDGLEVDHIPFPMPETRWILRQNWKKLTFLHWRVDPALLRAHLPEDLELDLFDGEAYVGCIPFVMEDVRPSGIPAVPGISTFGEFNILEQRTQAAHFHCEGFHSRTRDAVFGPIAARDPVQNEFLQLWRRATQFQGVVPAF